MSEVRAKRLNRVAVVLSIAIPVLVGLLFRKRMVYGWDVSFLPPIYAIINALTALLLPIALLAIKLKKQVLHRRIMQVCLALSAVFLLLYTLYHMGSDPTPYGGVGMLKTIYYLLLVSHIFLSAAVVPLVLFTYVRAVTGSFDRHRKLARIAFPVWWYVAASGVAVYVLISPYY
ncbi:MAG: DUF420 domain-containing protein [Bacteroidetes bacterium]|jgi:putative membrane protein|nr:DUF420 domain-containing protein [Bacteroidota bacterium]